MADKLPEGPNRARESLVNRVRGEAESEFRKDMQARTHVVTGSVELPTSGDSLVTVNFPVKFFKRPNSSFGGAMIENSEIIEGVFPSLSAVVLRYTIEELPPHNEVDEHALYVGADLAVSARGAVSNGFVLDFRFEGVALVNPTSGVQGDELTDEL